jgi:hypothetical protein
VERKETTRARNKRLLREQYEREHKLRPYYVPPEIENRKVKGWNGTHVPKPWLPPFVQMWQVPWAQFKKWQLGIYSGIGTDVMFHLYSQHANAVAKAMYEGKPVPEKVYRDYPRIASHPDFRGNFPNPLESQDYIRIGHTIIVALVNRFDLKDIVGIMQALIAFYKTGAFKSVKYYIPVSQTVAYIEREGASKKEALHLVTGLRDGLMMMFRAEE